MNLLNLLPREFALFFKDNFGESSYRVKQILEQVYRRRIMKWEKMSLLPQTLRAGLAEKLSLSLPAIKTKQIARDGTVKYLFELDDGVCVESVLVSEGKRLTVCFSTQAGCPLACTFCATGLGGFKRNLTTAEITGQVLAIEADAKTRVTNCVAMGQGEPLLNQDAVFKAFYILNDPACMGLSSRRLTLSTAGIAPGILELTHNRLPAKLAVSLHCARQQVRERLMPIAKKYPLPELKKALRLYVDKTKNRVTFEYILMEGLNDSEADVNALISFSHGLPVYINLIPWNPVPGLDFTKLLPEKSRKFADKLAAGGLETCVRREKGREIAAACGQLTQQLFNV